MGNLSEMIALFYKSVIYIFLFLLSFSLTYIIKNYAIKKSLVDIPSERSSHTVPTPHGGGIAIVITWFVGISYLFFIGQIGSSLYLALMAGIIISVVGYFDDLYKISAKIRLIIQMGVAVCGLFFLGGFVELDFGIFSITNQLFTNLFALILIVWYINLYNFLDGIDGYAGSEAIFLGIAGYLLFGGSHFLVLFVAVLGFLFWNWERAKIFMGDVGSTLLGYNIAIFTIYYANKKPSDFWTWVILFTIFWADATFTLIKRLRRGEKLSQAHKEHIYQILTQNGWHHSKVVFLLISIDVALYLFVVYVIR